jgi:phosphopantothenoylcysteine decarboxylase/phosphopantothenate--cysteine ligase
MAEPATILQQVAELVGCPQDLDGVRVLVTAGRTEEPIDPVRVITNRSSGKMGVALAEEALARGAKVTLLTGPIDVEVPEGVQVERVVTAEEMETAATRLFTECDVLLMAAAVGDFRSASPSKDKIRRKQGHLDLELEANPDILASLSKKRKKQILVGFALETGNKAGAGKEKLERKGVDLMVVNNPNDKGAAIGGDTNVVTLLEPDKDGRKLPILPKREVAQRILDWVVKRRTAPRRVKVEGSQGGVGRA